MPGWGKSLAQGKPARASNVFAKDPAWGADKAVDGNDGTRWATAAGTHQACWRWNWANPRRSIRRIWPRRIPAGSSRSSYNTRRVSCGRRSHRGTTIGEQWIRHFDPVTAQRVRLNVLDATNGPTIWEFQLFESPCVGERGRAK